MFVNVDIARPELRIHLKLPPASKTISEVNVSEIATPAPIPATHPSHRSYFCFFQLPTPPTTLSPVLCLWTVPNIYLNIVLDRLRLLTNIELFI